MQQDMMMEESNLGEMNSLRREFVIMIMMETTGLDTLLMEDHIHRRETASLVFVIWQAIFGK